MNDTVFNITIIGAGVVGLAVAEELSSQYSDVLVVEKKSVLRTGNKQPA